MTTLRRLFSEGPDWKQLFDVDLSRERSIEGRAIVLARDRGRMLLAIHGRDLDKPSWVPAEFLQFKIFQGVHEEFGEGVATMPEWLWLNLDQLTAASLRAGRDDMSASDAEKRREAAKSLRRQDKVFAPIRKNAKQRSIAK